MYYKIVEISANLAAFSHGCAIGWVSPALSHLTSANTPLDDGPLTSAQVSWIGSISAIGALVGCLSSGYITSYIGCKRSMLLSSIPAFLFWAIAAFGNSYRSLLIARFFCGYSGTGCMTNVILYVAETANDK